MQPCGRLRGVKAVEVAMTEGGMSGPEIRDVVEDEGTLFDTFYAASRRILLGQLYVMCGDLNEAQDCLQEAYLRAWQRWPRVSTYDDPAAWVRKVAWRLAINRWHRARRAVLTRSRQGSPANVVGANADRLDLAGALRRLSTGQREAIVLHHLVGMTVEEIAAQGNVPSGTVKARLSRGRVQLARFLSEEIPP
jgi:RNA polymerase sigma-70 factor (ECF subfamily)